MAYKFNPFTGKLDIAGGGGGAGTVTSITAGTGLTGGTITTSGTIAVNSSVVLKDANNNISANAFFNNLATITASGTQVVLTAASAPVSLVTGSGGQTIKLPNATTLTKGTIFSFNNNQSSGAILVNNNSNTLVASIPSGGYITVVLLDNTTAAGAWDRHDQSPSNVSWSTNTFDYPGSITSATWNGNTVAANRGGTGQSSPFVAGGIAYGASTSVLGVTPIGTTGQVLTSAGAGTPTWTTPSTGTVTSVTGTSPIASSGGATPAISIANAAADGVTKGAAAFTASDFDATAGVVSIDYTNGQAASTSSKGFLTSTDWNTFNGKAGTAQANTFSQPQIITGTSASAMLRVTQEGSGEALRIEDSPTPDATPFVVSSAGKVGVGIAPDATVGLSVDSTGIKFSNGSIQTVAAAVIPTDVQIFSTTGTFTWTKPANAKSVNVQLFGGGGGGGGGAKQPALTTKFGGGGGGGGSYINVNLPAAALGVTESVIIGAGGSAGTGTPATSGNGGSGLAGGSTSFNSITAAGGGAAFGGTSAAGSAGNGVLNANVGGSSSAGGTASAGAPIFATSTTMYGGAGGGGGGGISSSTAFAGGNGGRSNVLNYSGGAGGANTGVAGTAGTTNTSASSGLLAVGSAGGGGGAGLAVSGGAGGAGGFPAGGGGGGGATETGTTSGAGGVGGDGLAIITTYF